MTERTLHIHVENQNAFMDRAAEVAKRLDRGEDVRLKVHLSFVDLTTFLSSLHPARLHLASMLHQIGPSSIRSLAQRVGRDYKSVHQDIGKLLDLGLVAKRPDGKIEVPFDRVVAEINFGPQAEAAE